MNEPKWLFRITIERNARGGMENYNIVASNRADAEKQACKLAGVPEDTEPHTAVRGDQIHAVI